MYYLHLEYTQASVQCSMRYTTPCTHLLRCENAMQGMWCTAETDCLQHYVVYMQVAYAAGELMSPTQCVAQEPLLPATPLLKARIMHAN